MKLKVHDKTGQETSKQLELNAEVFGIEPHDHAIWLDVRLITANKRQGTHKTKGRVEVSGGGRKPFRQKGTGRARQGTIRAPHHVGGGRVFGPQPRLYKMKLNRKVKALARRSALTYKAKNNQIVLVENFNFEKPSTKSVARLISDFNFKGKRVLLCTAENAPAIVKSAANLPNIKVRESVTFSTYDVLQADILLMQESALQQVNEGLAK
ncbi:MAG: 50S ribosomal protein L4 [Caldithrix sp.]|nr:50S ribosomal protein L4 [Caldithrix sp.]